MTPEGIAAAVRVHGSNLCGACVKAWNHWRRLAFETFLENHVEGEDKPE